MRTPFDEGNTAGFLGKPKAGNPYRKGISMPTEIQQAADEWDRGHDTGVDDAKEELHNKRVSACKD